jgi:hypothetical protein
MSDKIQKILNKAKNICWYPSANRDIPTAYYINTFTENENPVKADLFIFSDPIYREWESNTIINHFTNNIHENFDDLSISLGVISIDCVEFKKIDAFNFGPELNLNGNLEVDIESPIYSAKFIVNENLENKCVINVLLVGCYNEPFCANFLIINNLKITFLVYKLPHYNYGERFMTGLWIYNTIPTLQVQYLATEIKNIKWNNGDNAVVEQYPVLGVPIEPPYFLEAKNSLVLNIDNQELIFKNFTRKDMHPDFSIKKTKDDNRVVTSTYFGINRLITENKQN